MPDDPRPDESRPGSGPDEPGPDEQPPGYEGRQRLRAALLAPTRRQVVVAVLLALVGFAGVTQVRENDVDDSYASLREQDLIDVLNGLAGARQRAEAERNRLRSTRDELESTTDRRQTAVEQARTEADTLAILAGLVPVTGSGVRVTVSEVTAPVRLGSMLDVVQELRTVGAEAIQVNGEVRVVAQTSFEEGDGGLLVDGQLLEAPYVIDAIGDPGLLEGAMSFIGGPRRAIVADGGDLEVDEVPSLDIEAVRQPVTPDFAEAVPGQ